MYNIIIEVYNSCIGTYSNIKIYFFMFFFLFIIIKHNYYSKNEKTNIKEKKYAQIKQMPNNNKQTNKQTNNKGCWCNITIYTIQKHRCQPSRFRRDRTAFGVFVPLSRCPTLHWICPTLCSDARISRIHRVSMRTRVVWRSMPFKYVKKFTFAAQSLHCVLSCPAN